MKVNAIFFPLTVSAFLIFSCEHMVERPPSITTSYKQGTIRYFGDVAADGCGWLVEVDSVHYNPANLGEEFAIDGLPVILDYDSTSEKTRCGFSAKVHDKIIITRMELDSSALEKGLVIDFGSPSYDGCEWVIKSGKVEYSPTKLPETFKIDRLEIMMVAEKMEEKYFCGARMAGLNKINIIYIDSLVEGEKIGATVYYFISSDII